MAAFTVDVSLPAVPAMVEALTTSLSRGQQIVGIFMFGMAFGQIPAGLVSDRVGRLPVLYAGMALFLVGAIASALASSIEVMLIGRFVQGIGSAPAIVLSRAIVRDISSGKAAARLMSLMTMIFTVAPVIAPSIGALLVAQWGMACAVHHDRLPWCIDRVRCAPLHLRNTHAGNGATSCTPVEVELFRVLFASTEYFRITSDHHAAGRLHVDDRTGRGAGRRDLRL